MKWITRIDASWAPVDLGRTLLGHPPYNIGQRVKRIKSLDLPQVMLRTPGLAVTGQSACQLHALFRKAGPQIHRAISSLALSSHGSHEAAPGRPGYVGSQQRRYAADSPARKRHWRLTENPRILSS